MYLKSIFVLGSLIAGNYLYAQSVKGIYVYNSNGNVPLSSVLVKADKESELFTDENGFVAVNSNLESGAIEISALGFESERITKENFTAKNEYLYVYLHPKSASIEEIQLTSFPKNNIFYSLTALDLQLKPFNSSQEILRYVPGLFVGQHAGGGKSEQIFLRGFDIDHGTDVSLSVDGMPVNMVSHAHGQGYADLHFLIPELIQDVNFNKGPYFADKGNFTTAGFVDFRTKDVLESNFVKAEIGQFGTYRGVFGYDFFNKAKKGGNHSLYIASEVNFTDGYFDASQSFNRINGLLKYHGNLSSNTILTAFASGFSSKWNASGQIPMRAIEDGSIGWFGAIDPNEGGSTSRYNANVKLTNYLTNGAKLSNQLYYSKYDFDLYSNFTFFLNDAENGDQIKQTEDRNLYGLNSRYEQNFQFGKVKSELTAGVQVRYDDINDLELSHTKDRTEILERLKYGDVNEANLGAFWSQKFSFFNGLSITPGLRYDYFSNQYNDFLDGNLYKSDSHFVSPKLNFNYNLNKNIELYTYLGKGFHSNDTRVAVLQNGKKVLPPAWGADFGGVFKLGKKLILQSSIWYLWLDQEFVYVGDEAVIEEGGKTERFGFDLSARYEIVKNLFADINVNFANPRALGVEKSENKIPLAPKFVSTGGITYKKGNGFNGNLSYRWMGDRPANEDKSVVAKGYFVADARINYSTSKWDVGLLVQNLFNTKWKETQFDTESMLQNETESVSEIHFTPGTPFFGKLVFTYYF